MGTDNNSAFFAECKWTNEKIDIDILEKLVKRSELFNFKEKHYYIFSKSGFTKGCKEKAKKMENINLIKYEDMLKIK